MVFDPYCKLEDRRHMIDWVSSRKRRESLIRYQEAEKWIEQQADIDGSAHQSVAVALKPVTYSWQRLDRNGSIDRDISAK